MRPLHTGVGKTAQEEEDTRLETKIVQSEMKKPEQHDFNKAIEIEARVQVAMILITADLVNWIMLRRSLYKSSGQRQILSSL